MECLVALRRDGLNRDPHKAQSRSPAGLCEVKVSGRISQRLVTNGYLGPSCALRGLLANSSDLMGAQNPLPVPSLDSRNPNPVSPLGREGFGCLS